MNQFRQSSPQDKNQDSCFPSFYSVSEKQILFLSTGLSANYEQLIIRLRFYTMGF